ncbi:MAG: hypothetical protein SGILL_006251 [Bacillariaceae sp.]
MATSLRSAPRELNAVPSVPFVISAAEFITAFSDSTEDHFGNCGSGPVDSKKYPDTCSQICAVGWTVRDEWIEYEFDVVEDGNVDITIGISSKRDTKILAIEIDGNKLAQWNAPGLDYHKFQDRVVQGHFLAADRHTLKLKFVTSNINVCSITVEYSDAPTPTEAPIAPKETPVGSRIKMYHELGYFWQCDNVCDDSDNKLDFDPMWCFQCDGAACNEDEHVKLRACDDSGTADNAFFEFVPVSDDKVQIRVAGTTLCLYTELYTQRFPRANTRLNSCDAGSNGQLWTTNGFGSFDSSRRFEVHPNGDSEYCLTTQHHPKDGEDARVEKCSFARKDVSNWWIKYNP